MSPNLTATYARVAETVGREVGCPTELVEGRSLDELRDAQIDVAFVCGLPYVRLQAEQPGALTLLAAPVLAGERYRGQPVYFSDVVVRRDSPYRSLADLHGCRWSHTDPDSFSGCVLTRYQLAALGETEAFFADVTYAGSHQLAIGRVLEAEVDAAAIDSQVLAVERLRNPALINRLRAVSSFGPSPVPPIVATRRLPTELARALRDTLVALSADDRGHAILEPGAIERFVPVADRDYDDIRRKAAVAQASGASV